MPDPAPLHCPKCQGHDLQPRGRRYPLYPLGLVAAMTCLVAIFHHASLPFDYTCRNCGMQITRRSRAAGCATVIFAIGLTLVLLSYLLRVAFLYWIATS
jgi:hypothetical protein